MILLEHILTVYIFGVYATIWLVHCLRAIDSNRY